MSDVQGTVKPPEHSIERSLREVLSRMNHTDDIRTEAKRKVTDMDRQMNELEQEASRLRMALFALAGKTLDQGKVREANNEARQKIRQANP